MENCKVIQKNEEQEREQENNTKKKVRDSGIELLRIIMMIQVIFLHLCGPGGYGNTIQKLVEDGSFSQIHNTIYLIMWLSSRYMMILWFMLYGYFSAEKTYTLRTAVDRAKKMHSPMVFYGIMITLVILATKLFDINPTTSLFKAITPILSGTWYFMSNYILLTLVIPFVNKAIKNISKREYIYLLSFFIVIFIWRICATDIDFFSDLFSIDNVFINGSKNFLTFFFMYLLGGYIKKYVPEKAINKYIYLALFFICTIVNFIMVKNINGYSVNIAGRGDNPIIIFQAITLLLFARELKFKSKFINRVSKANLAVYIIHEQPFVREMLWATLPFKNESFYQSNSYLYIIYGIITCIVIYIACNLIEQIRLLIVEKVKKYRTIIKENLNQDNI